MGFARPNSLQKFFQGEINKKGDIMGYIYKITNQINGKMYIGKTEDTIEKRFKTHCKEYKRARNEKRPLYDAMKKYGVENFIVEEVEKVDNALLGEREQYWISYYDTYHNGYNATKGGDGKRLLDYDLIIKTYKEVQNVRKTAELCHCDFHSVSKILKANNIEIKTSGEVLGIPIDQYDLQGNFIQTFSSPCEAARAVAHGERGEASHISDVCKGKRKTAYKYIWKYHNE